MSAAATADSFPHGDEHAHDAHHVHHGFIRTYVWSHDHKMIGLQYLFASMFFGAISGLLAMGVRWQLGFPGKPFPLIGKLLPTNIVGPDGAFLPGGYNMLVTMHATIMVFFVIMPLLIGVFGNFLIPLKIGAPDMAFPFLQRTELLAVFPVGRHRAQRFLERGSHQHVVSPLPELFLQRSHARRRMWAARRQAGGRATPR